MDYLTELVDQNELDKKSKDQMPILHPTFTVK